MSIAVSSTDTEATLARLAAPPPDPDPTVTESDLDAAREAMARTCLELRLARDTRERLTEGQLLQVCGRAGHEALAGRGSRRYTGGIRAGFANVPGEVP